MGAREAATTAMPARKAAATAMPTSETASAAMGLATTTTPAVSLTATATAVAAPRFGQRGAGEEQTRHRHGGYQPDRWAVRAATVCLSHDR
jgi:hypothetical protein